MHGSKFLCIIPEYLCWCGKARVGKGNDGKQKTKRKGKREAREREKEDKRKGTVQYKRQETVWR